MPDTEDTSAKPGDSASEDDILAEGREAFERCREAGQENRAAALDDLKFARLGEQWDAAIVKARDGRPCITANKLPAFIRQVVNDARQNKPSIKVKPADSSADPETAEILNGLIRDIEQASNADVAYDTASGDAVAIGFGYFRIGIEYSHDDTFDRDLRIQRIANPFSVDGDPNSMAADSSDWDVAFVSELVSKAEFRRRWKGAKEVDWSADGYDGLSSPWREDEQILVGEWWTREETLRTILKLSSGEIVGAAEFAQAKDLFDALGVTVQAERKVRSHKVRQRLMSGAELLEENDWAGRYIPIIPVYGDEVNVEGKRYFRSLIRDAKDAQRRYNYQVSAATEMSGLAPKAPFIGPEDAFTGVDAGKWDTANTENHAYLSYSGVTAPQRLQSNMGEQAAGLQLALQAGDDMKAIIGLYDASLGQKSNETSGRAIMARQREGDVSTFHFIDNLNRAIRHGGRVLIDLIPAVYDGPRIVRVLGQDGTASTVPVNQPTMVPPPGAPPPGAPGAGQGPSQGQPAGTPGAERIYDLSLGKYDVTVQSGPSFTTRREEAATQMTELIRAYPDAAPLLGDLLAKMQDWPEADEVARRLKLMLPPQLQEQDAQQQPQGPSPEQIQQFMAAFQQAQADLAKAQGEIEKLKADMGLKAAQLEIDKQRAGIEGYRAETERLKTQADVAKVLMPQPEPVPAQTGRLNGTGAPPQRY